MRPIFVFFSIVASCYCAIVQQQQQQQQHDTQVPHLLVKRQRPRGENQKPCKDEHGKVIEGCWNIHEPMTMIGLQPPSSEQPCRDENGHRIEGCWVTNPRPPYGNHPGNGKGGMGSPGSFYIVLGKSRIAELISV